MTTSGELLEHGGEAVADSRPPGGRLALAVKLRREATVEMDRRGFLFIGDANARCLHWAGCALVAWKRVRSPGDPPAVLQGGSAFWRFRDAPEPQPTDFGYKWVAEEAMPRIRQGILPESHFWLGFPATGEVCDITTGGQPEQCRKRLGMEWGPGHQIDDPLWMPIDEAAVRGWVYQADPAACLYGMSTLVNQLGFTREEVLP
jgi:hypothetical protein